MFLAISLKLLTRLKFVQFLCYVRNSWPTPTVPAVKKKNTHTHTTEKFTTASSARHCAAVNTCTFSNSLNVHICIVQYQTPRLEFWGVLFPRFWLILIFFSFRQRCFEVRLISFISWRVTCRIWGPTVKHCHLVNGTVMPIDAQFLANVSAVSPALVCVEAGSPSVVGFLICYREFFFVCLFVFGHFKIFQPPFF